MIKQEIIRLVLSRAIQYNLLTYRLDIISVIVHDELKKKFTLNDHLNL